MLGLVVFNTYISRWLDRYALCIWLVFVVNTFLMLAVVLQKLLTRLPWQTNCRFSSYLSLSVVHVSFFERFVISRRDNEHVGARGKCQVVRDGFEMWRQLVRIRRGVAPRIGVGGIWAKPQFTNITYRPGQLTLIRLIIVQALIRAYTVAILVTYYIKLQDFGQFWPILVTK